MSALKAVTTHFSVQGNLTFASNRGYRGAAMILANSSMTLGRNSHVLYANNHATTTGGAIYVTNNLYYTVVTDYFPYTDLQTRVKTVEFSACFVEGDGHDICEQFRRTGRRCTLRWITGTLLYSFKYLYFSTPLY